jgi:hypothetical protein
VGPIHHLLISPSFIPPLFFLFARKLCYYQYVLKICFCSSLVPSNLLFVDHIDVGSILRLANSSSFWCPHPSSTCIPFLLKKCSVIGSHTASHSHLFYFLFVLNQMFMVSSSPLWLQLIYIF